MSPKKITDAEKLELVELYRQSGETAASLASRYGVSNSTIGRLLKMSMSTDEYDLLVQQKRGAKLGRERHPGQEVEPPLLDLMAADPSDPADPDPVVAQQELEPDSSLTVAAIDAAAPPAPATIDEPTSERRLVRRRPSARTELAVPALAGAESQVAREEPLYTVEIAPPTVGTVNPRVTQLPELSEQEAVVSNMLTTAPVVERSSSLFEDEVAAEDEDVNALAAMFGEEIAEVDEDEEFADEDWDEESITAERSGREVLLTGDRSHLQVKPLSQATLPRTCYIVIDKFAELIVRPLKDFAELGQIPGEEVQQRTLPIFDNHRIAKRFSNQRTQRVIKVPDSRIFQKTIEHLRSKGIARLLVDGNIYSLN